MTNQIKTSRSFRSWFYFRTGWSVYFAFIFAAINTLVVTYYLAIENIPFLGEIFPTFTHYVVTAILVGIPILVAAGYIHFKRSAGFKSEADVSIETNPHARRTLLNTEAIVTSYLFSNELMMKMLKDEKLTDEEIKKLTKLQEKIREYSKHKTLSDSSFDLEEK
ncbi:uncharacterized protein METZ01_LOCUS206796 [marine metagenome]|uniref:Uncharacterized protein n=1 Tax=marine metagenome TaxID=408172 RepID=A0A382EUF1_9ZZZZ